VAQDEAVEQDQDEDADRDEDEDRRRAIADAMGGIEGELAMVECGAHRAAFTGPHRTGLLRRHGWRTDFGDIGQGLFVGRGQQGGVALLDRRFVALGLVHHLVGAEIGRFIGGIRRGIPGAWLEVILGRLVVRSLAHRRCCVSS
jgi:hypothetical protein